MRRPPWLFAAIGSHLAFLTCAVLLNLGGYERDGVVAFGSNGAPIFNRRAGTPLLRTTSVLSWQYVYTVYPTASSDPKHESYVQVPYTVNLFPNAACITNATSQLPEARTDYTCLYHSLGRSFDYEKIQNLTQAYFSTGFGGRWNGNFFFYYPLPGQEIDSPAVSRRDAPPQASSRAAAEGRSVPRQKRVANPEVPSSHLSADTRTLMAALVMTLCGWLAHLVATAAWPGQRPGPGPGQERTLRGGHYLPLGIFALATVLQTIATVMLGLSANTLRSGLQPFSLPGQQVVVLSTSAAFWGLLLATLICQWAGVGLYTKGRWERLRLQMPPGSRPGGVSFGHRSFPAGRRLRGAGNWEEQLPAYSRDDPMDRRQTRGSDLESAPECIPMQTPGGASGGDEEPGWRHNQRAVSR